MQVIFVETMKTTIKFYSHHETKSEREFENCISKEILEMLFVLNFILLLFT